MISQFSPAAWPAPDKPDRPPLVASPRGDPPPGWLLVLFVIVAFAVAFRAFQVRGF